MPTPPPPIHLLLLLQVWSQGLPVYNNQKFWKTTDGFLMEHKWNEHGPFTPWLEDGAAPTAG